MENEIKCPKCEHKPNESDLLHSCCGQIFNIFETGCICLNCKINFKFIICSKCKSWNKHLAWFGEFDSNISSNKQLLLSQLEFYARMKLNYFADLEALNTNQLIENKKQLQKYQDLVVLISNIQTSISYSTYEIKILNSLRLEWMYEYDF
jgi:hypothetical protein